MDEIITRVEGIVCHFGLYNVIYSGILENVPVFQCLFYKVNKENFWDISPHVFLVKGTQLSQKETHILRSEYEQNAAGNNDRYDERNATLCRMLLGNCGVIRKLSRMFIPVSLTILNDVEIIDVMYVDTPQLGNAINTLTPLFLTSIGTYVNEADVKSILPRELGAHASKKMKIEKVQIKSADFSLRHNNLKVIFSTGDTEKSVIGNFSKLFDVKIVSWSGYRFTIVCPKKFFVVLYSEDQCLLALRQSVYFLHKNVFNQSNTVPCLCEYIGPDLGGKGSVRSIYFNGFPNIWFRSIDRMDGEVATDVILDEIRAICGLPEVFEDHGRYQITASKTAPLITENDLEMFAFDGMSVRTNSLIMKPPICANSIADPAADDIKLFVTNGDIYRVSFPNFLIRLLQECVRWVDFPITRTDLSAHSERLAEMYIHSLGAKSKQIYTLIKSILNYVSHYFTSACSTMGFEWIVVKNSNEFYILNKNPEKDVKYISAFVNETFKLYWKKIMGDKREPKCVTERSPTGNFIIYQEGKLFTSFPSTYKCQEHWITVKSKFVSTCIFKFRNKEINMHDLQDEITKTVLFCAARRHVASFWTDQYSPEHYEVENANGVIERNVFYAVWGLSGKLNRQSLSATIVDDIDYIYYIKNMIQTMRICLIDEIGQSNVNEKIDLLEWKLASVYGVLFDIN
ncbi:helicase-primase subunit HP3 [Suid betaherpesvirus 2]|uniref:Helicase-primase subunit HP3 n=1 Tax=Suid betaherpesvirus 2 TaxID=1608255 RepID=U3GPM3_9BETA|nr:helicase-primase subunit HP3 [Suid betaherpesvirus 2]AGT99266.1 helicase-primase subunit HP3 [Suid betaherpesvirus 2]